MYVGYYPLIGHIICIYFLPFSSLSFHFVSGFLCFEKAKLINFIRSHLFIFTFTSFVLGDRFPQNIAPVYVKECCPYVFL